jgi:hypothetical protein
MDMPSIKPFVPIRLRQGGGQMFLSHSIVIGAKHRAAIELPTPAGINFVILAKAGIQIYPCI